MNKKDKVELFLQKEINKLKNRLLKELYERNNFSNEEILYLFPNNKLKHNGLPMKKGGRKKKEKLKIIRSQHLFNIIEDIIEETICKDWKENAWFNKFVDYRELSIGEPNVFLDKGELNEKKKITTINRNSATDIRSIV